MVQPTCKIEDGHSKHIGWLPWLQLEETVVMRVIKTAGPDMKLQPCL